MHESERTLVKSPPELWDLVSSPERMQGWMSALVGHAAEVEVTESEPGARLVWQARDEEGRIEVELEESGWGTKLSLRASGGTTRLEGWSEAILDEVCATERRPFKGVM